MSLKITYLSLSVDWIRLALKPVSDFRQSYMKLKVLNFAHQIVIVIRLSGLDWAWFRALLAGFLGPREAVRGHGEFGSEWRRSR